MTSPTSEQDPFEHAWKDLDERLIKGRSNLFEMARNASDRTEKNRLLDKAAGVDYALDMWEDLSAGSAAENGDFAGMWRTFTSVIEARLAATGFQPGYYQGVHLALTYQRGYGEDIDAPVIANPHV